MVYIISYDLMAPGKDYSALFEAIKSLGAWAHPLDSTWLVDTRHSASAIRDRVRARMDPNDLVIVGRFGPDWASYLGSEFNDWLQRIAVAV